VSDLLVTREHHWNAWQIRKFKKFTVLSDIPPCPNTTVAQHKTKSPCHFCDSIRHKIFWVYFCHLDSSLHSFRSLASAGTIFYDLKGHATKNKSFCLKDFGKNRHTQFIYILRKTYFCVNVFQQALRLYTIIFTRIPNKK